MAFRTGNPALNAKTFEDSLNQGGAGVSALQGGSIVARDDIMTLDGTVGKSALLLAILLAAASWTWYLVGIANPAVMMWTWGGAIAGFVVAMVAIFNKRSAPITAPLYAVCEGLFLGGISALFEGQYQYIVIQAVALTVGVFGTLLMAYMSRLIKATENFKLGVVAATGGIALVYLVSIVLGFFHISVPFIHSGGPIGIGFSLFVVLIAALNLVLDFDFIETGAEMRAPKYMEWYASFGLLVTLVWLYLEILRLLAKIRGGSRD
jgi:uncharacterized YccA/Bax inhibitor family protein